MRPDSPLCFAGNRVKGPGYQWWGNTDGKPGENDGGEPVVDKPGQDNSGHDSSTPVVKAAEAGSPDEAGNALMPEIKDSRSHVG